MNSDLLNPEVTENDVQKTIFSDVYTSVTGHTATEEELNALSAEERNEIEANYQYVQDHAMQVQKDQQAHEELISDPNNIFYDNGRLNTDISNTVNDGLGMSKQYAYKEAKQAMHDYAKLSSAEQAVVDTANRAKAIERDSTLITPQEARALGEQYGVELKYDKNVARGEVMFAIGQNIYKQELAQNLADFTADQDFSKLQNLGMVGSAISGGVGFYETAATVALSFFLPELAVATVAKVGMVGKTGLEIAHGVNLAYKTQRATKLATRSANTLKTLSNVSKAEGATEAAQTLQLFTKASNTAKRSEVLSARVATALKDASDTTKMAYNISNLALRAPGAEQAFTLGQRAMLSSADALVSSVPAMALSGYNSLRNQTETYTAKDIAIESLFAAGIGGIIPVAGLGFKALGNLGGDMFSNVKAHVNKTVDDMKYKSVMDGVNAEGVNFTGAKATKGLDEAAKGFKQPNPEFVNLASAFKATNMTEDEFMANFRYIAQKLCNGEVPSISSLPHKSMLLSHVASDIVDNIKKGFDDLSDEAWATIQQTTKGLFNELSLKGETGLLGRKAIRCVSSSQAKQILSDIYKATLDGDMDAYIRVASHVERQQNLVNEVLSLIDRVQQLKKFNRTKKGTADAIGLDAQENFKSSLADLIGRMRYGEDYDRLMELRKQKQVEEVLNGVTLDDSYNEIANLVATIQKEVIGDAEKFGKEVTLKDKRKVFNLDVDSLYELADELDSAARDIAELLDTDDLLRNKYGSADDLIEAINSNTVYGDTDLNQLFGMPRATTDEFSARVKEIETQQELTAIEKQKWEANKADKDYAEIEQSFLLRDKAIQQKNNGDTAGDSFFTKSKATIESIDTFLSEGITEVRTQLQRVLDSDDFKKFVDAAIIRGAESTRRAILKGNTSLIRSVIDQTVGEPLKKIGVTLSESDIVELADRFIDTIKTGKIKNLDFSPEAKIIDKALPEEAMIEHMEKGLQKNTTIDDLINPLLMEVQKLALNKQFQHMHSLNLVTKHAKELMKNPYIPGEVITKIFTFSPYNLKDANRNIEYLVRNSQAFVRDIETELKRKSSGTTATEKLLSGGVDLVEYIHNPENRKGILTALTYMDWYGSADAAKKAGVPFNADDAVVAQVIRDRYSTMLNNLTNVGSLRQKVGNRFNITKMKQANRSIPDTEVADVHKAFTNILNLVSEAGSEKEAGIARLNSIYDRLVSSTTSDRAKAALFALKNFDLDVMFNARGTSKLNFNEVRDSLFTGELMFLADDNIQGFNQMVAALDKITDALMGKPSKITKKGYDEFSAGWLNTYLYKTEKFSDIKHNLSNRYVADFNDIIVFKDVESELKAMDYIGYDSILDQLNHDFETGQRAYAVLKMAGSEPIRLAEDLMDFHDAYRYRHQHDLFKEGTTQGDASRLSKTARNSILANAAMAAGVDKAASRTSTRLFKAIADLFSAPLLVNAGVRSITDYSYQQEWMVLNGLIESKDLLGWTRGINSAKDLFQDPELRRLVGYNQFMTQDAILRMRTNVDTDSLGSTVGAAKTLEELWNALTDGKSKGIDKLERVSKAYSTLMINDFGCVDKFTQLHRASAALTLMKAIASQADTDMALMDRSLQQLLQRHGVQRNDWEFLRKYCNIELNDYLVQGGVERANLDKNFKLFIPDNLLNISDDVFKQEMIARKIDPNNKVAFDNFRNEMYEKASILINSSADEMTTLPTYRTANAMSMGLNPTSGVGQFVGAFTKFQSFGMACTQIHFGRRIAQYCNTQDAANVQTIHRMLLGVGGVDATKKIYGGLAHLMIATSVGQLIIDEAMDALKGQSQSFTDEQGRFNWGKVVDPIIAATGIASPILDGTIGKLAQGNMTTSGLSLQAFPSLSAFWRDVTKVAKPLASDDTTVGEKVGRSTAAFANVVAQKTGISNHVLTSLVWRHAVGGWLEEQERGAKNYRRYIQSKQRAGSSIDTWYSRYQTDPQLFGF